MKKFVRHLASILLCMCCIMQSTSVSIAAAPPGQAEPLYELTLKLQASCTVSSGVASCYGYAKASNPTSKVSIVVTLYKQTDKSWDRVSSWSLNNQDFFAEIDKNHSVGTGIYKVVISATVVGQNGKTETVSLTSSTATYN